MSQEKFINGLYVGDRTGAQRDYVLRQYKLVEEGYLTDNGKFENKHHYSRFLERLDNFENLVDKFLNLKTGESLILTTKENQIDDFDLHYLETYFNYKIDFKPMYRSNVITRLEDPSEEVIKERKWEFYKIPRNEKESLEQEIEWLRNRISSNQYTLVRPYVKQLKECITKLHKIELEEQGIVKGGDCYESE